MSDQAPDVMKNIWREQPVEVLEMSIEELRTRAGKFRSTIRWRNLREYAAGLVVAAAFSPLLFSGGNAIVRVGAGLIILGSVYAAYRLHRSGSARPVPSRLGLASCIEFHRSELARQYDLLRGVWKWYLGPLIPGLAVFLAGDAAVSPTPLGAVAVFALGGTVAGLVFFWIGRMNARAALGLRREIEALDTLLRQS